MEKPLRGRPPKYQDKIAALKKGKTIYFAGASQNSIKAIASKLGSLLKRKFTTSFIDDGVLVERVT